MKIKLFGLLLLLGSHASPLWAQEYQQTTVEIRGSADDFAGEVSAAITYASGDYGTSETTTSISMPFTLTKYFSKGDVALTVPYLYLETGRDVTVVGGKPKRTQKTSNHGTVSNDGLWKNIL